MATYDRLLVRPTVHALVEALCEATRVANQREPALATVGADWEVAVAEIRTQAEGVRSWRKGVKDAAPVVGLAWWTDAQNRRHFRVRADASGLDGMGKNEARPPLWFIAPDNVVVCRSGGESVLALCACGAVGKPHAIGWAGDRCGSCAAGEPAPARPGYFGVLRDVAQRINHLAFSPDGSLLAAGCKEEVYLWDLRQRALLGRLAGFREVQGIVFAHDGGRIAVAGGDRMLRWFDVRSGEEAEAFPVPKDIWYLGMSREGGVLVACGTVDGEVWGRTEGVWNLRFCLRHGSKAGCISQDAESLVLARREDRVLYDLTAHFLDDYPRTDWCLENRNERYETFAFGEGGGIVAHVRVNPSQPARASCYVERILASDGRRTWRVCHSFVEESPRFSPGGLWLAGFNQFAVVIQNVGYSSCAYRFHPSAGVLTALAFSPDDQTLAVAGQDGTVRLWPWRRMLGA